MAKVFIGVDPTGCRPRSTPTSSSAQCALSAAVRATQRHTLPR
jgi:hypothetical protein